MKSITIHGLDNALDKLIRRQAKQNNVSMNKTIKKLLRKSFGIDEGNEEDRTKEFIDLFGIWTKSEAEEFNKLTQGFRKVDREDWI